MANFGQLAVGGSGRAHHLAAICVADRLMAETNAKQRHLVASGADQLEANARFARSARAGREHDRVGARSEYVLDGGLVVTAHIDLRAESAEVMNQVPGEAIVIVDQRDARHGLPSRRADVLWGLRGGGVKRRAPRAHDDW